MLSSIMKELKLPCALCVVLLLSACIASLLSQSSTAHAAVNPNYSMKITYGGTTYTFTPTSTTSKYGNTEPGLGASYSSQSLDTGTWLMKAGSQTLGTIGMDITVGQQSNSNLTAQSTISSTISGMDAITGTHNFTEYPTPSDMTTGYISMAESAYGHTAVTYKSSTDMRLYTPDNSQTTSNTAKFIRTNATYGTGRAMVANMDNVIALENSAYNTLANFVCTYQNSEPTKSTDATPPAQSSVSGSTTAMPLSYSAPGTSRLTPCITRETLIKSSAALAIVSAAEGVLNVVSTAPSRILLLLAAMSGLATIVLQVTLLATGWILMREVIDQTPQNNINNALLNLLINWLTYIMNQHLSTTIKYMQDVAMGTQMGDQGASYAASHGTQPNVIASDIKSEIPDIGNNSVQIQVQ